MSREKEMQKKIEVRDGIERTQQVVRFIQNAKHERCIAMVEEMTKQVILPENQKRQIVSLCISNDCSTKQEAAKIVARYLANKYDK